MLLWPGGDKMPSYKTHSIHGEIVFSQLEERIPVDYEAFKTFCMGPDAMLLTDYRTFDYQHSHHTSSYFLTLIHMIKANHLQYNSEVMAFLYGQIDHFVLDSHLHPMIYYMTEGLPKKCSIHPHGLVEMWLDDYVMEEYHRTKIDYYRKRFMESPELKRLVDSLYERVYSTKHASSKYNLGFISTCLFDRVVRHSRTRFFSFIMDKFKIGDITYQHGYREVLPFLNSEKKVWFHPETEKRMIASFDELWNQSIVDSIDIMKDVNGYLYDDHRLRNPFLLNDISYNTGLSCGMGQKMKCVKEYVD